jgi:hypothetical protein
MRFLNVNLMFGGKFSVGATTPFVDTIRAIGAVVVGITEGCQEGQDALRSAGLKNAISSEDCDQTKTTVLEMVHNNMDSTCGRSDALLTNEIWFDDKVLELVDIKYVPTLDGYALPRRSGVFSRFREMATKKIFVVGVSHWPGGRFDDKHAMRLFSNGIIIIL